MHEAAIAKSILEIVGERLQSLGAHTNAQSVEVLFGEFRNVDPESVSFAFDSMRALFSGCSDCRLSINTVTAAAHCKDNHHQYRPQAENAYRCPTCGSGIGKLLQGEELDVVNVVIEIERPDKEKKQHARVGR
ncbi:MAG: hydrogenase maturation nickel metallochaperone HypA [Candidatus Melainabacteria bacterium]|nr:hydrogenase maturation nickel metallochaperone HypA [Candidatus Melainabacteria bacterium]